MNFEDLYKVYESAVTDLKKWNDILVKENFGLRAEVADLSDAIDLLDGGSSWGRK